MPTQKLNIKLGPTEVVIPVWIENSADTDGKTGLAYNTAGLSVAFGSQYSTATSFTLQSISDLTTYEAPSSSVHCRFGEYDSTNHPGLYLLYLDTSLFANEVQAWLTIRATSAKQTRIQLRVAEPVGDIDGSLPPAGTAPLPASASTNNTVTVAFWSLFGLPDDYFLGQYLFDRELVALAEIIGFEGSTGKFTIKACSTGGDWRINPSVGDKIYVLNEPTVWNDMGGRTLSSSGNTAVATATWASGTRTLTSFGTLVADVATAVWSAGSRTLTSFGTLVVDVAAAVWASATRTLTSFGSLVSDLIAAGGKVTVSTPVSSGGSFSIIKGMDYDSSDGAQSSITWSSADWPTLTSASVVFTAEKGSSSFTKSMTIDSATGTKSVRLTLTASETNLTTGPWRFSVTATLSNSHKVTLVLGTMTVRE